MEITLLFLSFSGSDPLFPLYLISSKCLELHLSPVKGKQELCLLSSPVYAAWSRLKRFLSLYPIISPCFLFIITPGLVLIDLLDNWHNTDTYEICFAERSNSFSLRLFMSFGDFYSVSLKCLQIRGRKYIHVKWLDNSAILLS